MHKSKEELLANLKIAMFEGKLKDILENAEKEMIKNNIKKAKDLYYDALYLFKSEGVDISKYHEQIKYIENIINN